MGCIGAGLTLSLSVVYLRHVRHFSTSFATLLLVLSPVVGLASAPIWVTMTDRFGPSGHRPETASVQDTLVVRAHRGHRLGGLMKLATMRELDDGYETRIVVTWNNPVNTWMIAVNEALGAPVPRHRDLGQVAVELVNR